MTENNQVYAAITITGCIYGQQFIQTITLDADRPTVHLENRIFWEGERYVRLEQSFPFASKEPGKILYGVPFGRVEYPKTVYCSLNGDPVPKSSPDDPTSAIRLVQHWVDIADSEAGITIGADHRMWTFDGNTLRNCMLRGIGWTSGGYILLDDMSERPNQRPPRGEYIFRYRLEAHEGKVPPTGRIGWELNRPVHSVAVADFEVASNPGIALPKLPDTTNTTVIISGIKPAEIGSTVILRCFESAGKTAELTLPHTPGWSFCETDFSETKEDTIPAGPVTFRPFEIKTIKIIRMHEHGNA